MKGAFNIVSGISLLIAVIFLGAIMPLIMTQTGLLAGTLTGSPVTQLLVYLIPLVVILALVMSVFGNAQDRIPPDVGY
jgi:hypothetical protein